MSDSFRIESETSLKVQAKIFGMPYTKSLLNWSILRLLLIVFLALVLRVLLLPNLSDIGPKTVDEKEYNQIAINLTTTGDFAVKEGVLTSLRPPFYPATVAVIYGLFGLENFLAVRLFQIGVNLLIVVVVYQVALELYDQKVAWRAALLAALYPSLWGHNYLLLTETLFTLWLCLVGWLLVRFARHKELVSIFLAGICLGLAALTRSVMWPSLPLLVIGIFCVGQLTWSKRLVASLLFALTFTGTIAPWAVRNTLLHQRLTLIDTSGGRILNWSMYTSIVPAETREKQGKWFDPAVVGKQKGATKTESGSEELALKNAYYVMSKNPLKTGQRMIENFFSFWGLEKEIVGGAQAGHFGSLTTKTILALAVIIVGFYGITVLMGIVGLIANPPTCRSAMIFILILIGHICAIHTLVYGHSRYHIPGMVLFMIFSASAWVAGTAVFQRRRRRQLICAAVVGSILVASWVIYQLNEPKEMEKVYKLLGWAQENSHH